MKKFASLVLPLILCLSLMSGIGVVFAEEARTVLTIGDVVDHSATYEGENKSKFWKLIPSTVKLLSEVRNLRWNMPIPAQSS